MNLVLTHARYQLLETIRVPVAVIGAAFFPAAAMVFFVVPFAGDDPVAATYATASMVTFAIMTSGLFQYGIGVSEDRAQPWEPYTRTLPVGATPRFVGRLLTGAVFMAIALVPVVIVAAVATRATVTVGQLLLAAACLVVVALPFTLMGLAIGYALPSKAALAVAQLLFFPLAFGGGLMSAPGHAPGFVETLAPYLPTRGAVELMWAAVGNFTINPTSLVMLAGWIVGAGAVAVTAYRRDEGHRFV
jgi:ABC-2 type transport system permease protein